MYMVHIVTKHIYIYIFILGHYNNHISHDIHPLTHIKVHVN